MLRCDYLKRKIAGCEYEVFVGLSLDSRDRLIAAEELLRGTLAQTSEVVKAALKRAAAAMIVAHSHLSGVAEPSSAHESLTVPLKEALIDSRTLDHLGVGGTPDETSR